MKNNMWQYENGFWIKIEDDMVAGKLDKIDSYPSIVIYNNGIHSSSALSVDIEQAKQEVELYKYVIERYLNLMSPEPVKEEM